MVGVPTDETVRPLREIAWAFFVFKEKFMELMTVTQVCELCGLHRNTIQRWAREGKFPTGAMIGHARKWRRSDVEAWLVAQFEEADQAA